MRDYGTDFEIAEITRRTLPRPPCGERAAERAGGASRERVASSPGSRPGGLSSSSGAQPGSTLIEVLVAGSVLTLGLLATVALFVRATRDVAAGKRSSVAALLAESRLESAAPVSREASGRVERLYYGLISRSWRAEPQKSPDRVLWVRDVTIRRYPLAAVEDGVLEDSDLVGATVDGPQLSILRVEVFAASEPVPSAAIERVEWAVR